MLFKVFSVLSLVCCSYGELLGMQRGVAAAAAGEAVTNFANRIRWEQLQRLYQSSSASHRALSLTALQG